MGLFDILTIFDWITPLTETVNDVVYTVSTGEIATPLSLDKKELGRAAKILRENGFTIVSGTTESWHDSAFLDVPDNQAQSARQLLAEYGINAN